MRRSDRHSASAAFQSLASAADAAARRLKRTGTMGELTPVLQNLLGSDRMLETVRAYSGEKLTASGRDRWADCDP